MRYTLFLAMLVFAAFFSYGFFHASRVVDRNGVFLSETLKYSSIAVGGNVIIDCGDSTKFSWSTDDNSIISASFGLAEDFQMFRDKPTRDFPVFIFFDRNLLTAVLGGAGGFTLKEIVALFGKTPKTQKGRVAFAIYGGITGYYWGYKYGLEVDVDCPSLIRRVSTDDAGMKDALEILLYRDSAEKVMLSALALEEYNASIIDIPTYKQHIERAKLVILSPEVKVGAEELASMETIFLYLQDQASSSVALDNRWYRIFEFDSNEEIMDTIAGVATTLGFIFLFLFAAALDGVFKVKEAIFQSSRHSKADKE